MNDDTFTTGGNVSLEDTKMEQLIERASVPSLATLFAAGKAAGLIKPAIEYGHTA